jgi:Flp pilus assembly protein TadG
MTSLNTFERIRSGLASFRRAERGNVVFTFALAVIPVIGFVGAAVDFSRANSVKAAMQQAVDATALMLSKEVSTLSSAQTGQKATDYFTAMFNRPEASGITITPTYTTTGGTKLTVAGTANIQTTFMKAMGKDSIAVNVTSTVSWGNTRLRVALVLDTTGSMASAGKIDALKSATKSLLTQLQGIAVNDGDVYVSIIPFAKNVNVGSTNYNASWIDWTDWKDEPAVLKTSKPSDWSSVGPGSSCPFSSSTHGFTCTSGPTNGSSNVSTIPSSGTYRGYICPSKNNGSQDHDDVGLYYNGCYDSVQTTTTTTNTVGTGSSASCWGYSNCSCTGSGSSKVCTQTNTTTAYTHTWIKNAHSTWIGCITDRGTSTAPSSDYDRKVTAPVAGDATTLYPAEQDYYCPPAAMGLNYNWTAMKTMVDNLYPLGGTDQPIGLVWGWQSLVGGGPFTAPAKDSNYAYKEIIVLMSDGLNTLDRWYGDGHTTNTTIDSRMYASSAVGSCANVKAAGFILYTLFVNTDNFPMSTLLQNCASSTDKFWMVTTASGIGTVFDKIVTDIKKLYVSK